MNNQIKNLGNRFNNTYLFVILLVISGATNFISSWIIKTYFPDRVAAPDLMFKVTPYYPQLQYFTDIFNLFSFVLIIYYLVTKKGKEINYIILNFACAYLLRAFLIILTPLGGINGNEATYGISSIKQYGAFPSGHTIMVAMTYLIINQQDAPKTLKILASASLIIEVISLILSRGHYSIDIVGALLLCYFVFNEIKRFKSSLVIE